MKRPKTTDKECKRQGMTDVPVANYSKMQDKYIDYLEAQANQRVIEELESVLNRTDKGSILEEHLIERIQQLKQD